MPDIDKQIFKHLCNFISKKWIVNRLDKDGNKVSMSKYADECDLVKSSIKKIVDAPEGYQIPLMSLTKICRKEGTTLSELFREFEKVYGVRYDV